MTLSIMSSGENLSSSSTRTRSWKLPCCVYTQETSSLYKLCASGRKLMIVWKQLTTYTCIYVTIMLLQLYGQFYGWGAGLLLLTSVYCRQCTYKLHLLFRPFQVVYWSSTYINNYALHNFSNSTSAHVQYGELYIGCIYHHKPSKLAKVLYL